MCRFVFYAGPPMIMADLVTRPQHSLIHQSYQSKLRREPLNGDGFGVGWYDDNHPGGPALFRSLKPAWSDTNLGEIARVITAQVIMAHVRAASPGLEVTEINCHPFKARDLLFMHNGGISDFEVVKRRLVSQLSEDAYRELRGTTDSETLFAMWRDWFHAFEAKGEGRRLDRMAQALEEVFDRLGEMRDADITDDSSWLNIAVTDGKDAVISRHALGGVEPPSLWIHRFHKVECVDGVCKFDATGSQRGVIVASEPFDDQRGWREVPAHHLILIEDRGQRVTERPIQSRVRV